MPPSRGGPMWVLALDTTTRDGSVAVVRDDVVVATRPGEPGVSHAERVPSDLERVLSDAGVALSDVDLFAVATGPGGFTGLRIGLATAQGLGLSLGRPVVGVPALEALAWDVLERHPDVAAAGAWLDATRGEVYSAAYRRGSAGAPVWPLVEVAPPTSALPDQTVAAWAPVVPADGIVVVGGSEALAATVRAGGWQPLAPASSLAAVVGRIAWRARQLGLSSAPEALTPVYVRRPDVEIERDRRQQAAQRA